MPVFLCYDPFMSQNPWESEKRKSMLEEFSKRRIEYFFISSPSELKAYLKKYENEASSIVFFPKNGKQRQYLFERYSEFNLHKIIFAHHNVNISSTNFSSVISDFYGDMELAISHLKEKGCKRIALFHANPGAYHDRPRIDSYKQIIDHEPLIFTTPNRMYPALSMLFECKERIDALICINDYVAFSLILILDKIDKNWREKLLILSFSNTLLSSIHTPSLSSISLNYSEGGREISTIHKAIEKNNRMAFMHIIMKSSLAKRETTEKEHPSGMVFSDYPMSSLEKFYSIVAPQAKCMALEKMLASCNDIDFKIIHQLLLSKSINEISSALYLSRESTKYHIRKYKKALKFEHTADLSAWLKIWIDPYKLEKKIIQDFPV